MQNKGRECRLPPLDNIGRQSQRNGNRRGMATAMAKNGQVWLVIGTPELQIKLLQLAVALIT